MPVGRTGSSFLRLDSTSVSDQQAPPILHSQSISEAAFRCSFSTSEETDDPLICTRNGYAITTAETCSPSSGGSSSRRDMSLRRSAFRRLRHRRKHHRSQDEHPWAPERHDSYFSNLSGKSGEIAHSQISKRQALKRLVSRKKIPVESTNQQTLQVGEPALYFHPKSKVFYCQGRVVRKMVLDPEYVARPSSPSDLDLCIITEDLKMLTLPLEVTLKIKNHQVPHYLDAALDQVKSLPENEFHVPSFPNIYRHPNDIVFSKPIPKEHEGLKTPEGGIREGGVTPKMMISPNPNILPSENQELRDEKRRGPKTVVIHYASRPGGDDGKENAQKEDTVSSMPKAIVSHIEDDLAVFARGSRRAHEAMVHEARIDHYPRAKWGGPVIKEKDKIALARLQKGDQPLQEHEVREKLPELERLLKHLNDSQLLRVWNNTIQAETNSWLSSPSLIRRSFTAKVQKLLPTSLFLRCLLLGLDPHEGARVPCIYHALSELSVKDINSIRELVLKSIYDVKEIEEEELLAQMEAILDSVLGQDHTELWDLVRIHGSQILLINGIIEQSSNSKVKDIEWWSLGPFRPEAETVALKDRINRPEKQVYFNSKTCQIVMTDEDHRKFHYNVHCLRASSASETNPSLFSWNVIPLGSPKHMERLEPENRTISDGVSNPSSEILDASPNPSNPEYSDELDGREDEVFVQEEDGFGDEDKEEDPYSQNSKDEDVVEYEAHPSPTSPPSSRRPSSVE